MFITRKKPGGFTLVEILLVLLITSVLVLGVNAAFRQTHMLYSRIEKQRPVYQKNRLFFNTLCEELNSLYMPEIDDEKQPEPFTLSALPDGTIKLSFFTLNASWRNTAVSNLPAKVGYQLTHDPDSGQMTLSRTEQLYSGEKAIGIEQKEAILEGFSGFSLQAVDPNSDIGPDAWKDNLKCEQKPPKAVKIKLSLPKDNKTNFEFEEIVKIPVNSQLSP